jgi:hypothetical protein
LLPSTCVCTGNLLHWVATSIPIYCVMATEVDRRSLVSIRNAGASLPLVRITDVMGLSIIHLQATGATTTTNTTSRGLRNSSVHPYTEQDPLRAAVEIVEVSGLDAIVIYIGNARMCRMRGDLNASFAYYLYVK